MWTWLFALVFMFQVKHLICDWLLQTSSQVQHKGIYADPVGLSHSIDHVIGTWLVIVLLAPALFQISPWTTLLIALVDGLIHYHIDWIKMRFGCKDMGQHKFWSQMGIDQFAHQITYLGIICVIIISAAAAANVQLS